MSLKPGHLAISRTTLQILRDIGKNLARAIDFKNCIPQPLLHGDDTCKLLEVIPPPELHILLGVTNKIVDELNAAWRDNLACKWAYWSNIVRSNYHGSRMCSQLLKKALLHYRDLPDHLKSFSVVLDQLMLCKILALAMTWSQISRLKYSNSHMLILTRHNCDSQGSHTISPCLRVLQVEAIKSLNIFWAMYRISSSWL